MLALTLYCRYSYLQGSDGSFVNTFNKDLTQNCAEAFSPASAPMAPVYLPKTAGHSHTKKEPHCSRC